MTWKDARLSNFSSALSLPDFGPFPKLGGKLGWPWRWPLRVVCRFYFGNLKIFPFADLRPQVFTNGETKICRRTDAWFRDDTTFSNVFPFLFFSPESKIGTDQDRESVERGGLREQKEGGRGTFGRPGERPSAGRQLQGGGYLRAAASSSTSLFREDHGKLDIFNLHSYNRHPIFYHIIHYYNINLRVSASLAHFSSWALEIKEVFLRDCWFLL